LRKVDAHGTAGNFLAGHCLLCLLCFLDSLVANVSEAFDLAGLAVCRERHTRDGSKFGEYVLDGIVFDVEGQVADEECVGGVGQCIIESLGTGLLTVTRLGWLAVVEVDVDLTAVE